MKIFKYIFDFGAKIQIRHFVPFNEKCENRENLKIPENRKKPGKLHFHIHISKLMKDIMALCPIAFSFVHDVTIKASPKKAFSQPAAASATVEVTKAAKTKHVLRIGQRQLGIATF